MEKILDFISVEEACRRASRNWYSLPHWIINLYECGDLHFHVGVISVRMDGEYIKGGLFHSLVLLDNNEIRMYMDPCFCNIGIEWGTE